MNKALLQNHKLIEELLILFFFSISRFSTGDVLFL